MFVLNSWKGKRGTIFSAKAELSSTRNQRITTHYVSRFRTARSIAQWIFRRAPSRSSMDQIKTSRPTSRLLELVVWSVDGYQSGPTDRTGCEQKGISNFFPVPSSIFTSSLTESHHRASLFPCHVANENDALLASSF